MSLITPTKKFVQTVQKDIKQYTAISLPTKGKRGPDFDSDNFGMIEEALNGIDILFTVSGQMGTGGKGNEGFAETAKLAPAEGDPDKRNQGTKNVAKTFKKFEPKDPKGQDQLSGYSDAANAALGLGGDSLTLWKLWTKYKDPATSKSENHQIRLEISVFGFSAVANILQATGGVLTATRAGTKAGEAGGKIAKSNLNFSGAGVDVSTDVKLFSDFSAVIGGILRSISGVIDAVKWARKGDPKADKGGARKNAELLGNSLQKSTGIVAAFASNYKAGGKLGYQIAGGGQTASDNAGAVVNLGGVVPFLQLVVSVIAAIKHGYTMVRMHLRQHDLKKTLKKLYKSPTNDVKEVQAAEAVRETLSKRIVRIGLNLAHSVFAIAAGVLNMTGIGLVVGMIINIASAALKLGQIGVRKIKQTLRNKKQSTGLLWLNPKKRWAMTTRN